MSASSGAGATDRGPPLDRAVYATLIRLATDPKRRFVVSLGGGSAPALAGNLALLAILEELDLTSSIAELWGTSAGAVIGGAFASGASTDELLGVLEGLGRGRALDISFGALALGVIRRMFGGSLPAGLARGRRIRATIDSALHAREFETCRIPFRCIATVDDGTARRKVFRRGPLLEAVFASMAIPGILHPAPPPPGEETGFLDGGIVEKTPIDSPINDHARLHPESDLVILCTHFSTPRRPAGPRSFLARLHETVVELENRVWESQLRDGRARPETTIFVLNPRLDDPDVLNFGRARHDFAIARTLFVESLQDGHLIAGMGTR